MAAASGWRQTARSGAKTARTRHSAALRRYDPGGTDVSFDSSLAVAPAEETAASEAFKDDSRPALATSEKEETAPETPAWRVTSKQRSLLIVEQSVEHNSGRGRPLIRVDLRLTTALRGQRKQDGLSQAAYLLRLEIIRLSPGIRVAGYVLGPWLAGDLALERGSCATPEPFWSAFQPHSGKVHGRILVSDLSRNRMLDLPWQTEGILPGPEPFPG